MLISSLHKSAVVKSRSSLYYHIYKRKKTVYNVELKLEIGNVTQNNFKANRAE